MGIGGSAANNGVHFMSDNYTAKFVMQKDNTYKIVTEKRLKITGIRKYVRKVPIVKGIFSMFTGSRWIAALILLSIFEDFVNYNEMMAGNDFARLAGAVIIIAVSLACLLYIFIRILRRSKDTWKYHGAEHKTIYAHEHGIELTLENVRDCPRIAERCGTNFAVFLALFYFASYFFIEYYSVRVVLSYVLAYELFDINNGDKLPVIKLFYKLGYWCQQKIFTREPSDIQILASIDTMKKLMELQNIADAPDGPAGGGVTG